MLRRVFVLLALLLAAPAGAQKWINPEEPTSIPCQTSPGTADATCPPFVLPTFARGICAYAYDNAAGASTWNLDLVAAPGTLWTVAGGAAKAAVNEGATCWYPTTLTVVPAPFNITADVVVTAIPTRLHLIVDKTAAVSTQFELWVWVLR